MWTNETVRAQKESLHYRQRANILNVRVFLLIGGGGSLVLTKDPRKRGKIH